MYYIYDNVSNVKKSFIPIYQKTMELEARVLKIESSGFDKNESSKNKTSKNKSSNNKTTLCLEE